MARALILLLVAMIFARFSASAATLDEPVRIDLRLTATDLVDDMAHAWLGGLPFANATPLIVAEIDAPVGLDTRFDEEVENHLYEVLRANPRLPLTLVHCSLCRQWVTVSEPRRTVLGRALSQPEGQEQLRQYPQLHALSLHFEVVRDELVLWAEIYEVTPPQKLVWSRRFSQSTSARTLLREPTRLVSTDEARREQERLLEGRDRVEFVTRFPIRTFSPNPESGLSATQVPPLLFLEQGIESVLSPKRNRRAGIAIGATSIKDTIQGWSVGPYYEQLLGRDEPSLTDPDLYFKVAVNFLRLEGPGAAIFSQNQIDINRLINATDDPGASLTAYQIGLEAHLKYRFGVAAFIEYMPTLETSQTIATQRFIFPFQSLGISGVFSW